MDEQPNLTERQLAIYEFIRDKIRNRGYGPTVREIGAAFHIASPNGVVCHLRALENKGMIIRDPGRSRAIQLANEPAFVGGFPLAGVVAAGVMHEAIEQDDRVDLNEMFDPADPNLFLLKVRGDSMIEAQIADGDFVVIRRQKTARKGQIVVAATEEGDATLKRWIPERGRIRLEPANSSMKPIYVKNAQIRGVLVGVVRKMK